MKLLDRCCGIELSVKASEQMVERRATALQAIDGDPNTAFRWLGVPVTWIEGTPLGDCGFVGLQIWGLTPHENRVNVSTVENAATGLRFQKRHFPQGQLP